MVVNSENRGGMTTEDNIDIMMMVVVPTQILIARKKNLSGYCLPSLISQFTNIASDVCKGVLDFFLIKVNEVGEHGLFGGRQR